MTTIKLIHKKVTSVACPAEGSADAARYHSRLPPGKG